MSAVSQISKLNPVMFHYNWQDDSEPLVAGFVAQELEEIFPEMVFTDKDGYKSLSYSALMPYTIKAIQELELKINTLQTLGGDNNTGISGFASAFFSDVLEKVENGVGYVKGIVTGSLKVGSPEKRTGITFFDEITGEPYCLSVVGENTKTTPGECPIMTVDSTPKPEPTVELTPTPEQISETTEDNTETTENIVETETPPKIPEPENSENTDTTDTTTQDTENQTPEPS